MRGEVNRAELDDTGESTSSACNRRRVTEVDEAAVAGREREHGREFRREVEDIREALKGNVFLPAFFSRPGTTLTTAHQCPARNPHSLSNFSDCPASCTSCRGDLRSKKYGSGNNIGLRKSENIRL